MTASGDPEDNSSRNAAYDRAEDAAERTQPPVDEFLVLDERQLIRIEAVHRGFLYQHLYAAACLLLAGKAGAGHIIVERDEDIEVQLPDARVYAQVKTRQDVLNPSVRSIRTACALGARGS